jgi:predicted nucleic acid-binding Zn ribbon protein
MFRTLRDVLDETVKDLGLTGCLEEAMAIFIWDEAVGEKVSENAQPYLFRGGILFVSAASPAWAQELTSMKLGLICELNRCLGKELVEDIRFQPRGRRLPRAAAPTEGEPDLRKIDLNQDEVREVEGATRSIRDGEIRKKLAELLLLDKKLRAWKLKNGWRPCPTCGALIEPGKACLTCHRGGQGQPEVL